MNDQRINTVSQIYAAALVEMADEAGELDAVADEAAQLGELLAADADLANLLSNRILSTDERAGAIERLFQGKVSDLLYRFLQVVNRKGRMAELPGILHAFGKLFAERRGVLQIDAYVAEKLDEEKLARIASSIGEALGKQVVPHQHVDPSLIGGLKLRIGDRLLDGSVAAQLKLLQQRMTAAGREKARAALQE